MSDSKTRQQLLNLQDERDGTALYEALAQSEKDPRLAEIYRRFASVEHKHALRWEQHLRSAGVTVPPDKVSWRTKVLIYLARRLGPSLIVPTLTAFEKTNAGKYSADDDQRDLAADEASHARLLTAISSTQGGMDGSTVARIEGRHRGAGGNALRAAVLGANDGLVSNLSLVMGVAGAAAAGQLAPSAVLVTGLAGLLAGACSMALGEWLSVQSSRELYLRQIAVEKAEIEAAPQEEAEELSLIYQSRGLPPDQANAIATRIVSEPTSALETLTREELGIDPQELGGSAYVAALTSFMLFAAGAIIPVVPFMFLGGWTAIAASAAFATAGLFTIGSAITLFTGRNALWSGARMVLFGLAAAAITFGIGRLIGVGLAG